MRDEALRWWGSLLRGGGLHGDTGALRSLSQGIHRNVMLTLWWTTSLREGGDTNKTHVVREVAEMRAMKLEMHSAARFTSSSQRSYLHLLKVVVGFPACKEFFSPSLSTYTRTWKSVLNNMMPVGFVKCGFTGWLISLWMEVAVPVLVPAQLVLLQEMCQNCQKCLTQGLKQMDGIKSDNDRKPK